MNAGRNDPCPCASGIKYKKCCMLKGRGINEEEAHVKGSQNHQDDLKSYNDKEIDTLVDAVYAIHRFMLAQQPHIKEYEKLRKMHGEVLSSMMQYYEDGKFFPTVDGDYTDQMMSSYAKGELSVINADFDLETKEGNQALVDILVYKAAPNMNCITEEYINSKRFRKPEKIGFLQSMLDSKVGLFEVAKVERNEGYVHLEEIFNGTKHKITDIGLSGDPSPDRFYLYTRIITCRGIAFNTGLNIVFSKSDTFIKEFIKRHKKDYLPIKEFVRFTELYNHYSKDTKKVRTVKR